MDCNVTYEELSACQAGDLPLPAAQRIRTHAASCVSCRARLSALEQTDLLLQALRPAAPAAGALLAARRRLAEVTQAAAAPEILTLEEAAEFLRITATEMDELAEELPAFELAGQVRIRRQKLLDWIEQRERGYTRETVASWTANDAGWLEQKGVA